MRSKKMNGPTSRRLAVGKARLTENPPRSVVLGMIRFSMASQANASPGRGSFPGKKDMERVSVRIERHYRRDRSDHKIGLDECLRASIAMQLRNHKVYLRNFT